MLRTRPLVAGSLALATALGGCFWPPPEEPGGDPVAANDAVTISEDSIRFIQVVSNDGAGAQVASVTQPTAGSVEMENASSILYTPADDDCTEAGEDPDTFTYTLTNGTSATVRVTITCVDDFHELRGDETDLEVTAGVTSVPVNPALVIYEPDGPDFVSAQLVLAYGELGDVLGVTVPGAGFTVSQNGSVVTVSGAGDLATYQAILRSVVLTNPGGLAPGTRNVELSLTNENSDADFTDRDVVVIGV